MNLAPCFSRPPPWGTRGTRIIDSANLLVLLVRSLYCHLLGSLLEYLYASQIICALSAGVSHEPIGNAPTGRH